MAGKISMIERRMNDNKLEIVDDHGKPIFSIEEKHEDGVLSIFVSGQIKNEVAHEFEDEVMAALSVCNTIVIDMKDTTYIASMALRSLLSAQQLIDEIDGASMTLVHVSKEVMKTLNESGFAEILAIQEE